MMKKLLVVTALCLFSAGAAVHAAGVGDDREATMKAIGGATAQLAGIAKGDKPYDAAVVKKSLDTIAMKIKGFPALFPEGKPDDDGHASPKIWESMDDFKAHASKLEADATAFAANVPANPAAVGQALGKLGPTCSDCHQKYRLKR